MGYIYSAIFVFFCIAISYFFYKKNIIITLLLILAVGLVSRIFIIQNSNLHDWDEKYHALVSKKLSHNFLKPVLYDNPVLDYKIENWTDNHIWLSKPPLALWLMNVSLTVFGTNTFGVRFPSLLLALLGIWLTFLIGKELFNPKVGVMASFFYSINGLLIELVGGNVSSDHVENTFIILFELSVFFIIKYQNKSFKILHPILIGTTVGLTFLAKWHISFLIFPIWFLYYIYSRSIELKHFVKLFSLSILVSLLVSSTWLTYIFIQFPNEAKVQIIGLIKPFYSVVQNHSAEWYYYINKLAVIFGELIYLPILYLFYAIVKVKNKSLFMLFSWLIIPLILFSIAETKRFTYILIAAPAVFILLAKYIDVVANLKVKYNVVIYLLLIALVGLPIRYHFERVKYFTSTQNQKTEFKEWKSNLNNFYPDSKNIIISESDKAIEIMFYSNHIAYDRIITPSELIILNDKGYMCFKDSLNSYIKIN